MTNYAVHSVKNAFNALKQQLTPECLTVFQGSETLAAVSSNQCASLRVFDKQMHILYMQTTRYLCKLCVLPFPSS